MLKGIPKILSPELLKVLCEMGHSDRIVIADGNFPSESMGKDAIVTWCTGDPGCDPSGIPTGYVRRKSGKPDAADAG